MTRSTLRRSTGMSRTAMIGGRGPEAQEPVLAGDPAARIEGLHARVVEIFRAMHRGDGVGLGEDEELPVTGPGTDVAGQHGGDGFAPRVARTQDAEAAAAVRNQTVLARLALESVVAVAEEDEVTLLHPLEE